MIRIKAQESRKAGRQAGRQSEVRQGEAALAWTHTPLWAWDGHQKAQPEVFEEHLKVTERN